MNNLTETDLLTAVKKAYAGIENYQLESSRYQLSIAEAQALRLSQIWYPWSNEQIFEFQVYQKLLCFPDFFVFLQAAAKVLKRTIYTYEFSYPEAIRMEYWGLKLPPTKIERSATFWDTQNPGTKVRLLSHYN